VRLAHRVYAPALRLALRFRAATVLVALALVAATAAVAWRMGGEFLPKLGEGAIVINVIRLAGISIDEAAAYNLRIERLLLDHFPDEIERVWSRIGTAEIATDPMGIELTDVFMALKPREHWKKASTQQELVARMNELLRDLPGQNAVFTQPIEMRMNEMIAGGRGDVAMKLYGDDFEVLVQKANEIGAILGSIQGAADLSTEQLTGQPVLQIRVDQEALARYGVSAKAVMQLVEQGKLVLVFPNGTRSRDQSDSKRGAATFALHAKGQVIPAHYEGPAQIRLIHLLRRPTIRVTFGAPIVISPDAPVDKETALKLTSELDEAMKAIAQQA